MLLPPALGFSPHPPVSVYGTGIVYTIAAFLGTTSACFATYDSLHITPLHCRTDLPTRLLLRLYRLFHFRPTLSSCVPTFLWHPLSLSYGAILPSSLTMLLPPALGFSPHPPVSVYGTGTCKTIAAFLGSRSVSFPTFVRSTSHPWLIWRICQPYTLNACSGFSIPGSYFPSASPQFCLHAVQEFQPVIHRLRLSSSP